MKYLILFFIFFISSCGYPDIDSVPNFENLIITEEEAIDLCKLNNTDKNELLNCLVKYYESNLNK